MAKAKQTPEAQRKRTLRELEVSKFVPGFGVLAVVIVLMGASPIAAAPAGPTTDDVSVEVVVLPYAELEFLGEPHLSLTVPPPGSTIPAAGVEFAVTGNAFATLQAAPGQFMKVPVLVSPTLGFRDRWLGQAVLGGASIGYRIRLDFPSQESLSGFSQVAVLPGTMQGPTAPPLKVNLDQLGGTELGQIHLEASPVWTASGGWAPPGIYTGEIILTLTASAN